MIFTAHPLPRLRDKQIGDPVKLKGVELDSAFFVAGIRADGYWSITDNHGRERFICAPSHLIKDDE